MDSFWGVTLVLLVVLTFLVAIVYRAMVYFGKHKDTDHEKVALSEVLPTLKSGDMVLFIAHTHGFTNSIFTGDLYSHSGMVVRDPEGGLRLSEATSSGSSEDPLIPRLQNYRGMLFLMQLDRPLTAEQQRTLQEKASMRTPYPNLVQLVRSWAGLKPSARHCMQHVAWLVDEIQLTPEALLQEGVRMSDTGVIRTSREVTALSGKKLNGGNAYGPIRQLVCDVGLK